MARRSLTGKGQICGIYTLGSEDPYLNSGHIETTGDGPILTASIGEDFAECRWPVTVKAQASVSADELAWYLARFAEALEAGFFMDASIGPAIYWRWTGKVLPGLADQSSESESGGPRRTLEQAAGTGERSYPGHGPRCGIYLMDEADNWKGDNFYGHIRGSTAVSGSVDEDYAASKWPVVIKAHDGVTKVKLSRYIVDLVGCVDEGFYFEATELRT